MAALRLGDLLASAPGDGPGLLGAASHGELLVVEQRGLSGTPGESWATARFDLASLTKPFVATLAIVLDQKGRLPLSAAIGEIAPGCDGKLANRRLGDLLRHRAGLQAWTPLYERCRVPEEVPGLLLGGELTGARRPTYSDLGYLLWGELAAQVCGRPLQELLREEVVRPLGLSVVPSPGPIAGVVPCSLSNAREVELAAEQGFALAPEEGRWWGAPQDGNARWLGRLGGHAGLFGSAADLLRLAEEWLTPGRLLEPRGVTRALAGRGRFILGWWRRRHRNSGGPALSPAAFGHVGFTGGSVWVDPERSLICVSLLCRDRLVDLAPWRRRLHAACVDQLGCGRPEPGLQSS